MILFCSVNCYILWLLFHLFHFYTKNSNVKWRYCRRVWFLGRLAWPSANSVSFRLFRHLWSCGIPQRRQLKDQPERIDFCQLFLQFMGMMEQPLSPVRPLWAKCAWWQTTRRPSYLLWLAFSILQLKVVSFLLVSPILLCVDSWLHCHWHRYNKCSDYALFRHLISK